MKRTVYILLLSMVFLSACGGTTPEATSIAEPASPPVQTPTPEPAPVPEPTETLEESMGPEL